MKMQFTILSGIIFTTSLLAACSGSSSPVQEVSDPIHTQSAETEEPVSPGEDMQSVHLPEVDPSAVDGDMDMDLRRDFHVSIH